MVVSQRTTEPTAVVSWSAVDVVGPEARTFLQSQLTQDLSDLEARSVRSLLLEPDGTVVTACFVSAHGDAFELVVPSELAEVAIARLRRFRLRSRCEVSSHDHARGEYRTEGERIGDRWPGVAEFAAHLGPHAFGRRVLDATVSFAKGCFTGQELVARLDARGANVPWRLVQARGPVADALDEYLRSSGPSGPSGVTSVVSVEDGVLALGFVHRSLLSHTPPEGITISAA